MLGCHIYFFCHALHGKSCVLLFSVIRHQCLSQDLKNCLSKTSIPQFLRSWVEKCCGQGLRQDSETMYLKLANVKTSVCPFFKKTTRYSDYNHNHVLLLEIKHNILNILMNTISSELPRGEKKNCIYLFLTSQPKFSQKMVGLRGDIWGFGCLLLSSGCGCGWIWWQKTYDNIR